MASVEELIDLVNCTIRFNADGVEYEGVIKEFFPAAQTAIIGKLVLLPNRLMGTLDFRCSELQNMRVINRPKAKCPEKREILPIYPKTFTEKLFDLDGSSDIEEDECLQVDYEMKLAPHLSEKVPRDYQIIDTFNTDFDLAIKHISKQDAIGVSLEGINISRSGTLTWLCISTRCCNFLFDILALGNHAFKKGLKSILENGRIKKIFHDCRLASDCLYHKYKVRLVNVFDTQVADFIVMMQMVEKNKIDSRVNTLDACLNYYLEVPSDHLYGLANFDNDKNSLNFHALRPLKYEIQDVLIKNVMYLHLLKRELEFALQTPLRRATDVYLNSVQKLKEKELLVVDHRPYELPLDIHLEGIQIFRYQDFEYLCSTAASGPPYREIDNPIKTYLNYCAEYKNGQKNDPGSIVNKQASQKFLTAPPEVNCKASDDYQKSVSRLKSSGNSSDNKNDRKHSDYSNPSVNYEAVKNKSKINNCENGGKTYVGHNSIAKSEGSQLSDSNVKHPMARGLAEFLRRLGNSQNAVKTSVDGSSEANRTDSEISAEAITVNNESVQRDSSNAIQLSKSACNPPCSDNQSKATTSQIRRPRTIGGKSQSELLEMSSVNTLKAAGTSDENTANNSSVNSKSTSKEGAAEINSVIPNPELVQINNSVVRKDVEISASELKDLEARVSARHALLRNRKRESSASVCASKSDPFTRRTQDKLIKETATLPENQECMSEGVTIYSSETLDKPSQFVVKVNHRRTTCLVDKYRMAGDKSFLWTDENTENCSKSSCEKPDNCTNSDDIWAAVREGLPCKPIDEKLRSRMIPAGMSGY